MTPRLKLVACLALVIAAASPGSLPGQAEKEQLPPDLDRVPRDAVSFVTVRVADLWNSDALKALRHGVAKESPDLLKDFEKAMGSRPDEIERATGFVFLGGQGPPHSVFLIGRTKPYEKDKLLAVLGKTEQQKVGQETIYSTAPSLAYWFISDQAYAVGSAADLRALLERKAHPDGPLAAPLKAAAGKDQVTLGANGELIATLAAGPNAPPIPAALKPLLKARSLTQTVNLGPSGVKAVGRLSFDNADDAKKADAAAKAGLDQARTAFAALGEPLSKAPDVPKMYLDLFTKADSALKEAKVNLKGSDVEVTAELKLEAKAASELFADSVKRVREAALRMRSSNNLHQLAVALHNYHATMGTMPPAAISSKAGKPLLSWRVALLPYIDEEKLYKEFKLDEPWDSEHNKKLLAKMPKVFASPRGDAGSTDTPYQGVVGKGTIFDGPKGVKLIQITDGTSNTIMIVEAAQGVPWTKPEDVTFDNNKLLPRLVAPNVNGFLVALCDGSVRWVQKTSDEKVLRWVITPNGGEVLPGDW